MKNILIFFIFFPILSCHTKVKISDTRSNNKICIDKVMKLDHGYGEIRNHACEKISLSNTIDNYVNSLKEINFQDCPVQFTNAFNKHIEAWQDTKLVTDKYSDLRGELHQLFDVLENSYDSLDFKRLQKNIWKTWKDIESEID